jgi:hypothetical protein
MSQLIKRIALDALGVSLIIIAVPIGWLPGPGGIPLALIGLGLLAKNNQWAKDLLNNFEARFKYYSRLAMNAPPRWQLGLDGISLSLLGLGLYLFFAVSGIYRVAATALITSCLIIALLNRSRGQRIYDKILRRKP